MAKFFRRGKTRVYFVPTLASQSAPSIATVTAGTNLTPEVGAMDGWTFDASRIPTPNLADVFTPQISGEDTVGAPTITFYEDDASTTLRTALAKGTAGFIVIAPTKAPAVGDPAEVYPVESSGVNREYTTANEPARQVCGFAVTAVPNQDATFAA